MNVLCNMFGRYIQYIPLMRYLFCKHKQLLHRYEHVTSKRKSELVSLGSTITQVQSCVTVKGLHMFSRFLLQLYCQFFSMQKWAQFDCFCILTLVLPSILMYSYEYINYLNKYTNAVFGIVTVADICPDICPPPTHTHAQVHAQVHAHTAYLPTLP